MFMKTEVDIEEFQSRLETLEIVEERYINLNKLIFEAINRLEEIRFTSLESNFNKYGLEVANSLLDRIENIK